MQTINPYINALKLMHPGMNWRSRYRDAKQLVKNRIQWDLHPFARQAKKKMIKVQNRYAGRKCVILCNGPSLMKVDFDELQQSGVFTFGLNKIDLLFDKTAFRPSVIVAVNPLVLEQNSNFFNKTSIPLFLDCYASGIGIKNRRNIHFLHSAYLKKEEFAEDCSFSIFQGYTVTYVAIQLAFHMGFQKVALVGADHYFKANSQGAPNQAVTSGDSDPDHFDPNYFAGGVKWHLPDLHNSEIAYRLAKETYSKHDRQIVNCTEGGYLEIFERKDLTDFLAM